MRRSSGRKKPGGGRSDGRGARLRLVSAAFCLVAAAYVGQAVHLQLLEREEWRERARDQWAREVEVPAERGGIYDRNGRALAVDAREYRAYLAPRELANERDATAAVKRVLGLSRRQVRELRRAETGWVAIPRRVSAAERDRLAAAVRRGLHFEPLSTRAYPNGRLAGRLLGDLGAEGHGRSGLELALDSVLAGAPGTVLSRRDGLGQLYPLPDGKLSAARPGRDVYLTLDSRLQSIAETALDEALRRTGASGGDILLMNPETGELLAVASRRGKADGGVPAFTSPYEPGSTAKPFLLAALLAEGEAGLEDRVYAEHGVYRRGGRTIRDVHPYDTLSVAEVIRYSSNIGAAKLARRLSPGEQYRYLRDFGFGMPTGVTYPSESGGTLRKPDEWSGFSQASLAMGYEVAATSLQLATAYAALANGGRLVRPYLVRSVRDASGDVVRRRRPRTVRRVIPDSVADRVKRVLVSVVEEGTATRASMATLQVAGKTGTARLTSSDGYEERRYAASFVGFTPAEDPRLLVLTKLTNPQGRYYGGLTAAPISRLTLQSALSADETLLPRGLELGSPLRRVEWGGETRRRDAGPFVFALGGSPDRWAGGSGADRRVLPDLRGLSVRSAAGRLQELGLTVALRGGGTIRRQHPAPGATVAAGDTVVLE